jgi:hypothetical protein
MCMWSNIYDAARCHFPENVGRLMHFLLWWFKNALLMKSTGTIHICSVHFVLHNSLNFSLQIPQHLLASRLLQWRDHPYVQRKDRHDWRRALWITSALQVCLHLHFQCHTILVPLALMKMPREGMTNLLPGLKNQKVGWRGYTGCTMGYQSGVHW